MILVRSSETPSLARVGMRVARAATRTPSGLYSANGSSTSEAASASLVPLER